MGGPPVVDWARYWQLLTLKTDLVTKWIHVPGRWNDPLVQTKQWKGDMSLVHGVRGTFIEQVHSQQQPGN